MHDSGFDHLHITPAQKEALGEVIWSADNVELTTVGIDIGSSTAHLMFARVHLQRLSTALSSRFVAVGREILWRSPIRLTPYCADSSIDAAALGDFVRASYAEAGLDRESIDSGAVILTGEALKRRNAREISELFAAEAGKFVCASAGHRLECAMAAHGSGAVALSRQHKNTILNVDVGGGTTKLALVQRGELIGEAAVAVGGRLVVQDEAGRLVRVEEPARRIARGLGIDLDVGGLLADGDRRRLLHAMADVVVSMINAGDRPEGLAKTLLLTDPLPVAPNLDAITFSGGVSEYLFGRETETYGDIGSGLAHRLQHALTDGLVAAPVWDPGQGIRATVIGASQFSVQVSGNTVTVTYPGALPMRNLPVLSCRFDLAGEIDREAVAREITAARIRFDLEDGSDPLAVAFSWAGEPSHSRLHAVAEGICAALPGTISGEYPLVVMIDGDVGMTLGRIIRDEIAPGCDVVAIDGIRLQAFDYVDIGEPMPSANVIPVVIKSLLF